MRYVYDRKIGIELIMGTEHPVRLVIWKNKPRQWMFAKLVNGICRWSHPFNTKREAIQTAEGYVAA